MEPSDSYRKSDLFVASHHTLPNPWKFAGRGDDRITTSDGVKILPLPLEGEIQQHHLVREAVVFGIDRLETPGMMLFREKDADGVRMSDTEFLNIIWPLIEDLKDYMKALAEITKESVLVMPEDMTCPWADIISIKRTQPYSEFASSIDELYNRLDNLRGPGLMLSMPELEIWIFLRFKELGITLLGKKSDFFGSGVDSLKAIQMRELIMKSIDLGGKAEECAPLIVLDTGNIEKLARKLVAIREGEDVERGNNDQIQIMEGLIKDFCFFEKHVPGSHSDSQDGKVVVLTGATGSLGSHVLAHLATQSDIRTIHCLLRPTGSTGISPHDSLCIGLQKRNFPGLYPMTTRRFPDIQPQSSDISKPDLGLSREMIRSLRMHATHIIHCAWEVNCALPTVSFRQQVASVQNLLKLSLTSTRSEPAHFLFCSSVGVAMRTPSTIPLVPETPIPSLTHCSPTGYAQSKLISERIIEKAVAEYGARATILRIGQIIPGGGRGTPKWNQNEMIPLLMRTAISIGVLPSRIGTRFGDTCSWVDVNKLAESIIEIAGLSSQDEGQIYDNGKNKGHREESQLVYNIVHPRPFSWFNDFLPSLKLAGLQYNVVSYREWVEKLSRSKIDLENNSSRELLEFWLAQLGNTYEFDEEREIRFDTQRAQGKSKTLRDMVNLVEGLKLVELAKGIINT
ncbi:hypothetical protein V490_08657 [Pseudogymnoascus sp. VKM F-3557]|nr:hypothetical protein V490_08657 [Pseudogymnoascus sp. VKM F-3557]